MNDPVFSVDISGPKENRYVTLALPATDCELLDVLDKFGVQDEKALRWEVIKHHHFGCLVPFLDGNGSVYDLNHLARELAMMDEECGIAFEGLLQVEIEKKEPFGLPKLIDLAYNANQGVCEVSPARSDQELGEFYVDNDLLPELAALPDHIVQLMDFGKIGKAQREAECGVFVPNRLDSPGGYVTQHTEMESIYNTLPHTPQRPTAAIILLLEHNQLQTRLELPADQQTMDNALDAIAAGDWDNEMHIRCLDCVAPALIPIIGDGDSIVQLNRLADRLDELNDKGRTNRLTKYKAILEATGIKSVDEAEVIAWHLHDYRFEPQYASPEDMAWDFLASALGAPAMMTLSEYINLTGCGEKLMAESHSVLTEYGMVAREDGQSLMPSTSQSPTNPGDMAMM